MLEIPITIRYKYPRAVEEEVEGESRLASASLGLQVDGAKFAS